MAFVKDLKVSSASTDAKRAAEEGHSVFVFKFGMPNLNSAVSSSVSGAAEVIGNRGCWLEVAGLRSELRC